MLVTLRSLQNIRRTLGCKVTAQKMKFSIKDILRMGFFGAAHGWREGGQKRAPLPKICPTYRTMMKLGTVIPSPKKI